MPSPQTILNLAATAANQYRTLAVSWHVLLGAFLLALLAGWRPSKRVAGGILAAPIASVSAVAWASGNPFNGATFAALTLLLIYLASRLDRQPVDIPSLPVLLPGAVLVAFGWTYPHFLAADHWTAYMYAAPFGLLPCPTLSAVIGLTLVLGLHPRSWSLALAGVGVAYGVIGVFTLGVTLDYGLLAGAALLGVVVSMPAGVRQDSLRKIFLVCGILSSALYVAMLVFVPMLWEGYSSASQTISELSAIGAPARSLWVVPGAFYTVLVTAFGWGVFKSAGRIHVLRIVGGLIVAYGSLGLFWPFAPMHLRQTLAAGGGTLSDTMHLVLAGVTVLLMLLAIGFGAAAFGKPFRVYSTATLVILMTFGALTFLDAPRLAENLPTPWLGVWERINVGVFLLWVVALAAALLRPKIPRVSETVRLKADTTGVEATPSRLQASS